MCYKCCSQPYLPQAFLKHIYTKIAIKHENLLSILSKHAQKNVNVNVILPKSLTLTAKNLVQVTWQNNVNVLLLKKFYCTINSNYWILGDLLLPANNQESAACAAVRSGLCRGEKPSSSRTSWSPCRSTTPKRWWRHVIVSWRTGIQESSVSCG